MKNIQFQKSVHLVFKRRDDFICWNFPEPLNPWSCNINGRCWYRLFWLFLFLYPSPQWRFFLAYDIYLSGSFAISIYLHLFFGSPTSFSISLHSLWAPLHYTLFLPSWGSPCQIHLAKTSPYLKISAILEQQ